jgi:hypothetical protein
LTDQNTGTWGFPKGKMVGSYIYAAEEVFQETGLETTHSKGYFAEHDDILFFVLGVTNVER